MDITGLLAARGHLLLTAGTKAHIRQLEDLALQSDSHIVLAGRRHPLLADLSVAENIALPAMFHRNVPPEKIIKRLAAPARVLGVEDIMGRRPADLSRRQVLRVKVLRALARECGVLLMPSPPLVDAAAALEGIQALDSGVRLWVACLENDAQIYAQLNFNPVSLWESQ